MWCFNSRGAEENYNKEENRVERKRRELWKNEKKTELHGGGNRVRGEEMKRRKMALEKGLRGVRFCSLKFFFLSKFKFSPDFSQYVTSM